MIKFEQYLRQFQIIRESEKMTYKEVAERSGLDNKQTAYNILKMKHVSLENLLKLEKFFNKL